jgi:hypothetical protein
VATSLRPLGVGEILDAGIKVVTRHWKPLAGTILLLTTPVFVVYVLLLASIDSELLDVNATFGGSASSSDTLDSDDATVLVGLGLSYLVLFIAFLIGFVACFKGVSDAWLGTEPSISRSLRFAVRHLFKTVVLGLVAGIGVTIGFFLCLAPGVWIGICWVLCLPALLFERIGPFKALNRSFSLVKGRWWATFLLWIVGYLLVSIIGFIVQAGLLGIADAIADDNTAVTAVATVIGSAASSAITYPYLAAVLTILYFDQRVRKEGFDLQLQAEGFGSARDPDAPLPEPLVGEEVYTPEQRAAAPYWPPPPGWTPPPVESPWESPGGWSAPSAGDAPSSGRGGADAPRERLPVDPLPRDERAPWGPPPPGGASPPPADTPRGPAPGADAPPPAGPTPGDPLRPEDEPPPSYPGWSDKKPEDEERKDQQDRPDRAGWLPPEAPRGPGGL